MRRTTIALLAALGRGGRADDSESAIRWVLAGPFGPVLVGFIAVGLLGFALWRFVEGLTDADRRGTSAKLSQNSSTIVAIIRLSAVTPGRFSSRDMVGCEHRSGPLSGERPRAILNAGSARSASQSLASA